MEKEKKPRNANVKITSDIGYQPNIQVPAGSVGQKDGNKTKLDL